ncbi:MAG TPA: cytochrome c3 family protein [Chthoniobacterales bacterium]
MAQIFSPRVSLWFKTLLIIFPLALVGGGVAAYRFSFSSYATQVGVPVDQPVPFSHQHHVAGLGIDCQYCHSTVTKTADAGMPDTHTCMTCHSQIWTEAPVLQPVRNSLSSGLPIRWTRVHNLADYVYFNHRVHVNNGISCTKCHGDVQSMPLMKKQATLQMGWCLECHRHPAAAFAPPDAVFQPPQVFTLDWRLDADPEAKRAVLKKVADVPSVRELTDCSTCHR